LTIELRETGKFMLKTKIQDFLRRMGLYDRLKETVAYDCYQYLRFGRPVRWRQNELSFYRSLLGDRPQEMLVFDVGANRGQRTKVFLQLGARVVAVEPDSTNQAHLVSQFSHPGRNPVTVVGKAVSDAANTATMWVHAPGSGLNSLSQKWVDMLGEDPTRFGEKLDFSGRQQVETVTLESLMAEFGVPDYIKIDVEGHEAPVLRGLKRPVALLSFEVNLPEFLAEGLECVEILGRLDGSGRFNWSRDCQGGFALPEWAGAVEFASVLRECMELSIEVFWKVPDAQAPSM
jgi:FkbM family methyltransferase